MYSLQSLQSLFRVWNCDWTWTRFTQSQKTTTSSEWQHSYRKVEAGSLCTSIRKTDTFWLLHTFYWQVKCSQDTWNCEAVLWAWICEKQKFVRVALFQDGNESQESLLNDEANWTAKNLDCRLESSASKWSREYLLQLGNAFCESVPSYVVKVKNCIAVLLPKEMICSC